MLRGCLAKNPQHRLSSVADARLDVDDAQAEMDSPTWEGARPYHLRGGSGPCH
jgi:hypothetical protein